MPARRGGTADPRVGHADVEVPPVVEEDEALREAHVADLADPLVGRRREEERLTRPGDWRPGLVAVEQRLTRLIGKGGKPGIAGLRVVGAVVDEDDPVVGPDGGRAGSTSRESNRRAGEEDRSQHALPGHDGGSPSCPSEHRERGSGSGRPWRRTRRASSAPGRRTSPRSRCPLPSTSSATLRSGPPRRPPATSVTIAPLFDQPRAYGVEANAGPCLSQRTRSADVATMRSPPCRRTRCRDVATVGGLDRTRVLAAAGPLPRLPGIVGGEQHRLGSDREVEAVIAVAGPMREVPLNAPRRPHRGSGVHLALARRRPG